MKNRLAIYLLLIGLLIRLVLAIQPSFKIDMDTWSAWATRLINIGFANFYSNEIWTNYPPGYLYILYLLGQIKTIFNLHEGLFQYLLKIPSIFAEIILAQIVFNQLYRHSKKWAYIGIGLILFNPAFIFNSAIWGQIDGIFTLLLLLAILYLEKGKIIICSILLGISLLVKPQTIFIAPALLLSFKTFKLKNFLKLAIPGLMVIFILSVPFFKFPVLPDLIALIKKMVGDYPYNSMFAYNFWGIFGFWINDSTQWANFSLLNWGNILLAIYWFIIIYIYLKKRFSLLVLATLSLLSFYFLPTRVHDRYLYPALVFLILTTIKQKSKVLALLTAALSIIHLLDLYQVYIYYDVFYLKMSVPLYNDFYRFVAETARFLSMVSTLIFITVTYFLLKIGYGSKEN